MNEIKITAVKTSEFDHSTPPSDLRVEVESPNGQLVLLISRTGAKQLKAHLERYVPNGDSRLG